MVEMSKLKFHDEIKKYKKLMEQVPDPNEGRILEIKQSIRNGTFLTREKIEATAGIIADILMGNRGGV